MQDRIQIYKRVGKHLLHVSVIHIWMIIERQLIYNAAQYLCSQKRNRWIITPNKKHVQQNIVVIRLSTSLRADLRLEPDTQFKVTQNVMKLLYVSHNHQDSGP